MVKNYKSLKQITGWQALEALGLVRPTALQLAADPQAAEKMKPKSMAAACRQLGCSQKQLENALKHDPMQPRKRLGRPKKKLDVSDEQIRWATSISTLSQQIGMPMPERTTVFNRAHGKQLKADDMRAMYRAEGVTQKFVRSRLGRPKLKPAPVQMMQLAEVKCQFNWAKTAGFEMIQLDECLFQADARRAVAWSKKGQPLRT
jgi:hypothetical protein